MNTNDLKEEIQNKLNPNVYRQLFSGPSDECMGKFGKLIDEIPEEECESDSYDDEDDSDDNEDEVDSHDEDEESKNSPSNKRNKVKPNNLHKMDSNKDS